jgi:arsenite oxidase small subunit
MNREIAARSLWREEVSFRQAEEQYVSRRQLGRFLVLTSLGMFVGNVWIWARSRARRVPAFFARTVARIGELPVGGWKSFSYPGPDDPCLLIRRSADRYVAFQQKCTHLSCAVVYSAARDRIECPCHQGYFSAETGAVLQGPPPRPLARIRLERRGEELVAMAVEEGEER